MHDPGVVVSKAQAQQLIGESPWRDRLSRSQSCLQVKRRAQEHNVMTLFRGQRVLLFVYSRKINRTVHKHATLHALMP